MHGLEGVRGGKHCVKTSVKLLGHAVQLVRLFGRHLSQFVAHLIQPCFCASSIYPGGQSQVLVATLSYLGGVQAVQVAVFVSSHFLQLVEH